VIWYQGENENTDAYAAAYYSNLTGLLAEWRADWGNPTMPFAIMQIHYNVDKEYAAITRETQLNVHLSDPATCIGVTQDFPAGGSGGWHPPYKSTPSERLARSCLSVVYRSDVYPPTGPIADPGRSFISGSQITVNFTYAETGLTTGLFLSAPGAPGPIKVAGADGVYYYDVTAQIVGNSLVVSSASVPNPRSVAYVWTYGSGNLYSNAQLPVFPFTLTSDEGGPPPTPPPTSSNLALNRPVAVSSAVSGNPGAYAVDGSLTTYWRSQSSLPAEWMVVDLGGVMSVSQVKLTWDSNRRPTAYTIQVSTDNVNWTTVYSTTSGSGTTDVISFASGSARYVKMNSTAWANKRDHIRLVELEVYQ
jgi:hypothetical protein